MTVKFKLISVKYYLPQLTTSPFWITLVSPKFALVFSQMHSSKPAKCIVKISTLVNSHINGCFGFMTNIWGTCSCLSVQSFQPWGQGDGGVYKLSLIHFYKWQYLYNPGMISFPVWSHIPSRGMYPEEAMDPGEYGPRGMGPERGIVPGRMSYGPRGYGLRGGYGPGEYGRKGGMMSLNVWFYV